MSKNIEYDSAGYPHKVNEPVASPQATSDDTCPDGSWAGPLRPTAGYTGLLSGCESDPSGLHECGVDEHHRVCKCVSCGGTWPNPEWHEPAAQPAAGTTPMHEIQEALHLVKQAHAYLNSKTPEPDQAKHLLKDARKLLEAAKEQVRVTPGGDAGRIQRSGVST